MERACLLYFGIASAVATPLIELKQRKDFHALCLSIRNWTLLPQALHPDISY
jgi:hypothetical protein